MNESRAAQRRVYRDLRTLCLFIGPNRSGHSLVGSMIDAHPNAVIATAFSVFEDKGLTGRLAFADAGAMFDGIIKKSRRDARRGKPSQRVRPDGTSYETSYPISGQGYRRGQRLLAIGTKRGPATGRALSANPNVLSELADLSGLSIRLIHVVRNPFDNIASMSFAGGPDAPVVGIYAEIAERVARTERGGWAVLHVHLEDVISQPSIEVERLCEFLGLPIEAAHQRSCAGILLEQPHETRYERSWSRDQCAEIEGLMAAFPWLQRYRAAPQPEVGN